MDITFLRSQNHAMQRTEPLIAGVLS